MCLSESTNEIIPSSDTNLPGGRTTGPECVQIYCQLSEPYRIDAHVSLLDISIYPHSARTMAHWRTICTRLNRQIVTKPALVPLGIHMSILVCSTYHMVTQAQPWWRSHNNIKHWYVVATSSRDSNQNLLMSSDVYRKNCRDMHSWYYVFKQRI